MAADSRFYASAGPVTLGALRAALGLAEPQDDARHFTGVAPLHLAGPDDVAFMEGRKNLPALKATKAGAAVIEEAFAEHVPVGCVALLVASPQAEFIKIARLFHPPVQPKPGIHPSAVIAPDAVIGAGCEIGAFVYVGAGAEIGAHSILGHHCSVGDGCKLGAHGRVHAHASMAYCIAGDHVVLHPGARIGNEGFGFITTPQGQHVTMPQLGRVIIGDGAEIGAGSCIDRGAGGDTVIGPGVRIDNLVQIGHNVTIGRGAVIVAQVGISGSTNIGDYAVLAGQAGVTGHLNIGARARVGAQAGVMNDVPAGTDVVGSPAWPAKEAMRAFARLRRLASTKPNEKTG
ncbi:MAG: UDP-3-O-(3-hydroxymyristoyl)glucosamine N-acyltransferase [Acetobacteraceae bacterium]|nr:UDP-3-O-(3-hydroxymyristoyl)glucosamine N-acyltransferase [Acetobacteraceae bacterium]